MKYITQLLLWIQGKPEISWLDMQSKILIFLKRLEQQSSQRNTENVVQSPSMYMTQRF